MAVLARVRDFLPMMADSNTELLKKMEENPEDVDIENTDGDQQVIAMVRCRLPYDVLNTPAYPTTSSLAVFSVVLRSALLVSSCSTSSIPIERQGAQ